MLSPCILSCSFESWSMECVLDFSTHLLVFFVMVVCVHASDGDDLTPLNPHSLLLVNYSAEPLFCTVGRGKAGES